MRCQIVFSDVDGTLLNSAHQLSENTLYAIRALQKRGIPFVIVSARSPAGVYPIQEKYGFQSPVISYSGALILDAHRNVLAEEGFSPQTAERILSAIDKSGLDCAWNIYSAPAWIVKNKRDPRVLREESIVYTSAAEGNAGSGNCGPGRKALKSCFEHAAGREDTQ